jgi:hypothetical protein
LDNQLQLKQKLKREEKNDLVVYGATLAQQDKDWVESEKVRKEERRVIARQIYEERLRLSELKTEQR